MHNFVEPLGNWNPQLLRELKGRLKPRNILLASVISVLGQIGIFMYFQTQLPNPINRIADIYNKYCTGKPLPNSKEPLCLPDGLDNLIINSQLWSLDRFISLSIIGILILLLAGTYLLISDLATEKRRGTLNFTRLSPHSTASILTGKLLGVPILIYLVAVVAVPFHLWAGLAAKISFGQILSFYGVLVGSCIFFYSAALLYGIVSSWLGGFQGWLGSGTVLALLMLTKGISTTSYYNSTTWLKLLNPFCLIPHLSASSFNEAFATGLEGFKWFSLPLGDSVLTAVGFVLLNYSILTWFIWQAWQRCFRNPKATMLSKQQSYLLTACFTVLTLGCANYNSIENRSVYAAPLLENLLALSLLNLLLYLCLIAAVTPHRQTLQDWVSARPKRGSNSKRFADSSLVKDLIWGEKSPAVVAIALNVVIAIIPLALFILLSPAQSATGINAAAKVNESRTGALFGLTLVASLILIYASIAQLRLFMRTQQRTL
ncbi:ABC transporter permease [Coleofasciculus sp. FACHB-SPT36]|uniref:ABC transporter permease n=1 Tax=Cyanophyceae TaxID=3028117 RepID=UPI0018EF6353|nr:ABC transporter permease [Coleofasciculus sp. FACHB-SPT36]